MAAQTELPVRSLTQAPPTVTQSPSTAHDIKPGTPAFTYLQHVYSKIPKDQPFQDNIHFKDGASFLEYMCSPASSATVPIQEQDLTQPLSAYYISSSHNTYLSGNQLYGSASTDAYTHVLRSGCRCLEIDVWDGEEPAANVAGAGDGGDGGGGGDEDDEASASAGRRRSESKPSRWSRIKAKAANIRGSSPKSGHHNIPNLHPTKSHVEAGQQQASDSSTATPHHLPEGEPIVLHGFTLTQAVSFRAVCEAIRDSAFVTSDLPIIVSLEVHAGLEQQQKMVDIMKELWKDHLVDLASVDEKGLKVLPSPSLLRKKILIKVKASQNSDTTGELGEAPLEHVTSTGTQSSTGETAGGASSHKKAPKIHSALSALGVYTRAFTFRHWDQPEARMPNHVFSFSEGKMIEMHSDPVSGPALFKHNKKFLTRVFPRGTRIRSSNVDPTIHWRMGAQMVALNWQRLDQGMMLNEGMFSGSQGYVLKPEGYRTEDPDHPELEHAAPAKKGLLDLRIELLIAQNLPLPPDREPSYRERMKPYVQAHLHVDAHGPPGQDKSRRSSKDDSDTPPADEDAENKKNYPRRSKTTRSDQPNFEGETLSWSGIVDAADELSFVRLKIKDDRPLAQDDLIAWACIRLDRLQPGLRLIDLLDAKGQPSTAFLLVRISKEISPDGPPAGPPSPVQVTSS